jgi:flagellin
MTVINTNINAMMARNSMTTNSRQMSAAMEQLSTGQRINSAKDDAAGLAISDKMTSQIRGLDMSVRNANDAISLLQTAEGAMIQQTAMLQRMRELSLQASSDSTTATDKGYLNTEYQSLATELNNIGAQTRWNGFTVLDGTHGSGKTTAGVSEATGGEDGAGTPGDGTYVFHIGANTQSEDNVMVQIRSMTTTAGGELAGIASTDVKTTASALSAVDAIDTALQNINDVRANMGAHINQLTYAVDDLTTVSQNAVLSRSRILDTDYAVASSNLARTQIIQQAATAMLAQANQQPQTVLALLK